MKKRRLGKSNLEVSEVGIKNYPGWSAVAQTSIWLANALSYLLFFLD